MRLIHTVVIGLWALTTLDAQPAFDVASIRPSAKLPNGLYGNYRMTGGPGTSDPGRMIAENRDLRSLILKAYDLRPYRFLSPESLADMRFDVTAIIPPETTKAQFLLMQQNLLATRLGLVVYHEKKEVAAYELVVAKGGSKLKPTVAPKDDDGYISYAPTKDHARLQSVGDTMEHFAFALTDHLNAPGLTGKYDFTLIWVPANLRLEDDPGLTLEGALPSQLGLTLTQSKKQIDVLVLDRVNKTPTEN